MSAQLLITSIVTLRWVRGRDSDVNREVGAAVGADFISVRSPERANVAYDPYDSDFYN